MISTLVSRTERQTIPVTDSPAWRHSICWRAILAGTTAAIGIQLLLTSLGLGAGLATFSPLNDNDPLERFNTGAAIIWSLCALVSLWFGALIAGRFSHSWHSGFVHGMLVWSLTLIITVLLLSKGTGMVLGGGLKLLANIGIAGVGVSAAQSDLDRDAVKQTTDELGSFTEEAAQSVPTNAAPKAITRAHRTVSLAVARLFATDSDLDSQPNRLAVVHALMESTQMNEAEANHTVDDWVDSYRQLKANLDDAKARAQQAAKAAADRASRQLSRAAIETFFALLLGLVVSAAAGSFGGRYAARHLESNIIVRSREVEDANAPQV